LQEDEDEEEDELKRKQAESNDSSKREREQRRLEVGVEEEAVQHGTASLSQKYQEIGRRTCKMAVTKLAK
jgi:hypothetical protein